jgi:polyhydroxyalkanoate synthesis regulator phasin
LAESEEKDTDEPFHRWVLAGRRSDTDEEIREIVETLVALWQLSETEERRYLSEQMESLISLAKLRHHENWASEQEWSEEQIQQVLDIVTLWSTIGDDKEMSHQVEDMMAVYRHARSEEERRGMLAKLVALMPMAKEGLEGQRGQLGLGREAKVPVETPKVDLEDGLSKRVAEGLAKDQTFSLLCEVAPDEATHNTVKGLQNTWRYGGTPKEIMKMMGKIETIITTGIIPVAEDSDEEWKDVPDDNEASEQGFWQTSIEKEDEEPWGEYNVLLVDKLDGQSTRLDVGWMLMKAFHNAKPRRFQVTMV